jgi:hypothetical protein
MKCIADFDGVESEDDAPDTSYYQWVTFMQIFQVRANLRNLRNLKNLRNPEIRVDRFGILDVN